jgi:hypothetical protein
VALVLFSAVVSDQRDIAAERRAIRELHEARALAELRAADALAPGSDVVKSRGSLVPAVVVVKGLPGPAEASGGDAMSGADGDAAAKGLEALGHDPGTVFYLLSRPEPGIESDARVQRLHAAIEALDAPLVVATDAAAAEDLAQAFGSKPLPFGSEVRVGGRRLFAVDGLEASLGDDARKRVIWRQLSAAVPEGPVL